MRGAEVFAAQLSTHLVELGHEILIVALLDGKDQLPFTGNILPLNVALSKKMFEASMQRTQDDAMSDTRAEGFAAALIQGMARGSPRAQHAVTARKAAAAAVQKQADEATAAAVKKQAEEVGSGALLLPQRVR